MLTKHQVNAIVDTFLDSEPMQFVRRMMQRERYSRRRRPQKRCCVSERQLAEESKSFALGEGISYAEARQRVLQSYRRGHPTPYARSAAFEVEAEDLRHQIAQTEADVQRYSNEMRKPQIDRIIRYADQQRARGRHLSYDEAKAEVSRRR